VETKQDWEKIKNLFGVALERSPDERNSFLREACGADKFLRELMIPRAASWNVH
jgi:hypothetical protein